MKKPSTHQLIEAAGGELAVIDSNITVFSMRGGASIAAIEAALARRGLRVEAFDGGPLGRDSYIVKRNVRGFKEVRVNDKTGAHGVGTRFVVEIYPNGVLKIRENRRRSGYETTVAALYTRLLISEVRGKMAKKKGRR